jgi:hypothetical protein
MRRLRGYLYSQHPVRTKAFERRKHSSRGVSNLLRPISDAIGKLIWWRLNRNGRAGKDHGGAWTYGTPVPSVLWNDVVHIAHPSDECESVMVGIHDVEWRYVDEPINK